MTRAELGTAPDGSEPGHGGGQAGSEAGNGPAPDGNEPGHGAAQAGSEPAHGRGRWPVAAAAFFYLGLGVLAMWNTWVHGIDVSGLGNAGDPSIAYWSLGYVAHHILDPARWFTTRAAAWPGGVNLLDNTSTPLLGVLAAPLTLTAGPVASLDVLMTLAIASSAFGAFLLARHFTRENLGAFVAGLAYLLAGGFASGALYGHLMTAWMVIPPLLLLLADKALRADRGAEVPARRRLPRVYVLGAMFGLLLAAQFMVSTEIFADCVLMIAIGIIACLALFPRAAFASFGAALRFFAAGAGVSIVLLGWPAWEALAGPDHVTGAAHPKLVGVGIRLASAALPHSTPSPLFCLLDGLHRCPALLPPGSLGVPLVLAFAIAAAITFRQPLARFTALMALVAFILSMGSRPILHASGNAHAAIPLPFAVLTHIQVLRNAEPTRFERFDALFLAVVLALAIASISRRFNPAGARRSRGLAAGAISGALCLAATIPLLPSWPYPFARATVPSFFTSPAVDAIPRGAVALTYPFPSDVGLGTAWSSAMLWQVASGFRFRLVGAYLLTPDHTSRVATFFPDGHGALARFLSEPSLLASGASVTPARQLPGATAANVCREIRSWRVDVALVDLHAPGSTGIVARLSVLLASRPVIAGGIAMWLGVSSKCSLDRGSRA